MTAGISPAPARPARSKLEAVIRISSLTNRRPESLGPGSKERKSVLVNLAADMGLVVDATRSKPELGEQIAGLLGAPWDDKCWSAGSTITLDGLNAILLGAQVGIASQRQAPQLELFESSPKAHVAFVPARSKLEAVTRMSSLTGAPPEQLGPGSKERRSVLLNLATRLTPDIDTTGTKPQLGAAISTALGVPWDETCWSVGHTITLVGLNRLLEGAERRVASHGRAESALFYSAREEGPALLTALRDALPPTWDGRHCVEQMRESEYSHWAQDEWAAFYFEFVGLPALINTFGGGPRKYANTRFDYGLGHPWDLKVHMAASSTAPLNDCVAVDEALDAGAGVGFLVLTGETHYDDGEFRAWQRDYRSQFGKVAKARVTAPKYLRKSKPRFSPRLLEAFYVHDRSALQLALEDGSMKVMRQGTQTSGAPRPPKYALDLVKARFHGRLLLGQVVL